ncbi:MAG: hypothetical protein GXO50_08140 [Chlorobi bacterium]|nr:hypothetical protein [Chlorobiota bacterium]
MSLSAGNIKGSDILEEFISESGIDLSEVYDFVTGKRYAAVILNNGNIGIAANIINITDFDFISAGSFDVKIPEHRLFLSAYFNAHFNYADNNLLHEDLFSIVDFSFYKSLVMVGYSKPMTEKLKKKNVSVHIFDNQVEAPFIKDQSMLNSYIAKSDSVILTGTSIINNTLGEILNNAKQNSDIFLTGPSVPMSKYILEKKNIKGLFGTVFTENTGKIIDLIKKDKGTDCLKKYGKKVAMIKLQDGNL